MKNETQKPTPQPTPQTEETLSVSSAGSARSAFETELSDLRSENDSLKTALRLHNARDEIISSLTTERARSPQLLFEFSTSCLEFDDNGALKNAAALITDLKQRFPEQFVVEPPPPQQIHPPRSVPSINSGAGRTGARHPLTKEMLAAMKPREIAKLDWNDVKQVLEQ